MNKLDLEIMEEIDGLLVKFNEKLSKLFLLELWLMNLKKDVIKKPKPMPGLI